MSDEPRKKNPRYHVFECEPLAVPHDENDDGIPAWVQIGTDIAGATDRKAIRHGHGEIPREAIKAKAAKVLAGVQGKVDEWPPVTFSDPERTFSDDEWQAVVRFTDKHWVSTALVAIVTILHPLGEWRMADGPWGEGREPVLVKVVDGEVVAMIAPVRREDHPLPPSE